MPTNASAQSKDLFPTKTKDSKDTVLAAAKAYMARKAMEDQRMSGPAPRDDEQDLTGEEDSDSSSSEVEVL
ncbi:hypothetical protein THAR02_08559 [Trichoderma harzianum]|uniref:Uncharacterized protein n=1 Tax=Trichoderma harzianum TaxID=5544 RepID=A0A0F9X269_TRIHA|nr:hypothetical protein THAR02_08559 [Trichoderma harzianum]